MNISIGMIALNEAEFIEKNLTQHYEWNGGNVHQIIVVEGAVKEYPKKNITKNGLSTDGTGEIIRNFMKYNDPEHKIYYVCGKWKDKTEQRNQYINLIDKKTDVLIVIDCDEFYPKSQQKLISNAIEMFPQKDSFEVPIVNLWHRQDLQVQGSYWNVPHLKVYRWYEGSCYGEHHAQLINGSRNFHTRDEKYQCLPYIRMIHYGYCRNQTYIQDKCQYYINRGETKTRPIYVTARGDYFTWKEGMTTLSNGVNVISYDGVLPECFVENKENCYLEQEVATNEY